MCLLSLPYEFDGFDVLAIFNCHTNLTWLMGLLSLPSDFHCVDVFASVITTACSTSKL